MCICLKRKANAKTHSSSNVSHTKKPELTSRSSGNTNRNANMQTPTLVSAHPSWEARQKLKEKEKGALSAAAGKRITFDDDSD